MPAHRALRPLVVAAVVAVVIVASWGLGRIGAPRAEPRSGGVPEGASPDPYGATSEEPVGEETREEAALAVSEGGHLALLEILGEAVGPERAAGRVCVSPDGTTVVAGYEDGSLRVWDARSEPSQLVRTVRAHAGRVDALAWSPDGARIASAGGEEIAVWDVRTARATLRLPRRKGSLFALAFHPDGHRLYASAWPDAVDVWDLPSGEKSGTLRSELPTVPLTKAPVGGPLPPHVLAVGMDGSWLAAGDNSYPVRIFDTAFGHPARCLPGFGTGVSDVVATLDGRLVSTSGRTLRVWDTRTWEEVASIRGPNGLVAPTEDGVSVICTDPEAHVLTLWSLRAGTLTDDMEVGSKPLALAVRGRAIWVGCGDGTIRRYEHRP